MASYSPLAERELKNTICLFDVDGTLSESRLVRAFLLCNDASPRDGQEPGLFHLVQSVVYLGWAGRCVEKTAPLASPRPKRIVSIRAKTTMYNMVSRQKSYRIMIRMGLMRMKKKKKKKKKGKVRKKGETRKK
jgi:hypothetical protein